MFRLCCLDRCLAGDKGGREHYRLDDNPWPEAGVTPWLTGLPSLTKTHSPSAEYWSNSIAVCAIMKDENITDVAEWVAYHKYAASPPTQVHQPATMEQTMLN